MGMICVGIDVSKDRLDVHVLPADQAFAVARNGEGLAELVDRLKRLAPALVAVEATGGFETMVAAALAAAALPLAVVNPAQVRHFAQALGRRAKTDPIDAAMIARFAEATRLEPRPLADEATRFLADLVARRRQIIEMIVAEKNRERRTDVKHVKKSIGRVITALEKELASVDADIDDETLVENLDRAGSRNRGFRFPGRHIRLSYLIRQCLRQQCFRQRCFRRQHFR